MPKTACRHFCEGLRKNSRSLFSLSLEGIFLFSTKSLSKKNFSLFSIHNSRQHIKRRAVERKIVYMIFQSRLAVLSSKKLWVEKFNLMFNSNSHPFFILSFSASLLDPLYVIIHTPQSDVQKEYDGRSSHFPLYVIRFECDFISYTSHYLLRVYVIECV